MVEELNLSKLVSNIVVAKTYSNCRLCLAEIKEQYMRFEDSVTLDSENFQPLSEVLSQVLGLQDEVAEELSGLEAVCITCVENTLQTAKFLQQCKDSTKILSNILDHLSNTLNIDIENPSENQKLYITVGENESELVLQEEDRETPRRGNSKNKFECMECNEWFNSFADLKSHNITYHSSLTCDKCFELFPDEKELKFHSSHKHKHKCPSCPQYRTNEKALKEHIDRAHSTYMCKSCGKACKGLDKLHMHEQSHSSISECPKCGKKYRVHQFFLKHTKLCIEGLLDPHPTRSELERAFSCEKCGKSYSTPGGLRVHMRFEHGNAKHHICDFCGKRFTAPSYLKVHMIKHTGEKNFTCDICGNKFVSKEALLYHTRRHTGEKPYSCRYCEEKFVNASSRAEHIKFKHIGPQLQCDICMRKFVTAFFLKKHKERHHDPRSKLYHARFASDGVAVGSYLNEVKE
ncbi:zinc finger protein 846 [Plutella xylostella]|uniref:zinc finger protein 846 n=1 Tax=Plutella xylostella TaxID=51655 RepID=UPI0020321FD3|nr:zinc finger protein 846 [Plutella xylostella]